jgi:NTP pyrophosphatase (non-canonical NTP hydrolase)
MSATERAAAKELVRRLIDAGFNPETLDIQQALAVVEEAGEFAQAFRRWKGMARTTGTFDAVRLELADVVVTAYVMADVLGINLDEDVTNRIRAVLDRPMRKDVTS